MQPLVLERMGSAASIRASAPARSSAFICLAISTIWAGTLSGASAITPLAAARDLAWSPVR